MNTTTDSRTDRTTLPFERFWRFLKEHPNCIVEAGTATSSLFDFEDLHWGLIQEEDGRAVAQLVRGKNLVGEIIIDPAEVAYVGASPDAEGAARGQWVFEAMGGNRDQEYVVAYFVLNHGLEELAKHEVLKH